jgi:cytosine deaminase
MLILDNCLVPYSALGLPEKARLKVRDIDLDPVVHVTLYIMEGKVSSIEPYNGSIQQGAQDLGGTLLSPRLVDAHVHLDKAHTWDRAPNRSGTFAEALRVLGEDRLKWTEEDVYRRANYTLQCAWAYGTTAVRTHLDIGWPEAEASFSAISKLREEWKGRIELQAVSLASVEAYDGPNGSALADMPVKYGAAAIGGMPVMNPHLDRQLDALMRLATEREVALDLHVDESGDPQALTLLAVAEAVIRNEFHYPVTCGHCCSLAVQDPELQKRVLQKVKEAGIHIISLPLCNLYLQDRFATESPKTKPAKTPFWRGVTLINEWMDQGTITACASDNVRDAFYAYGDLDAFEVFISSVRTAHLDNYLVRALDVVTKAPATIMELPDHGQISVGLPARFISFPSHSYSEWLSRPQQKRRIFERDQWITAELPEPSELS